MTKNTARIRQKISSKLIQQYRSYGWPGNIRELEHLIERSVILATDGILNEDLVPQKTIRDEAAPAHLLNRSLEEVERDYIIAVLKRCMGKISGPGSAAELLKVPGNTLHSKMKKLAISKSDYFN